MTISYTLEIVAGGDSSLSNVVFEPAEPCAAGECPEPPECVDGVDPATGLPCDRLTAGVPALSIDKSSPDLAGARIGDTVTYRIEVANTGASDYTVADPATVVDDLTDVLDDAAYGGDAAIAEGRTDGSFAYAEPRLVWTGPLASGSRSRSPTR
ncbi:DUF7927 domain-containing protein [Nocardioides sambongensis]|uniref:DUF7927 domain-containing protein n=1 Tax=Nocardioides sambongensis TaxID=2589074 RepID=UPI0015E83830|nr:hypothetical protein [Nocardioides sambongensis]